MNKSYKKRPAGPKMKQIGGRDLVDLVFSWSTADLQNRDFYDGQVMEIPETFMSTVEYMKAFIPPFLEEVHADLHSSTQELSQAPTCEVWIQRSKDFRPPKDLFYDISLKGSKESVNGGKTYRPVVGDLIALTDVKPKCIDDLSKSKHSYLIAFVYGTRGKESSTLSILSSKLIKVGSMHEDEWENTQKKESFLAVYMANMTTNIRIWKALNSELEGKNMNIIQKVLQNNENDDEKCVICSWKTKNDPPPFSKDVAHSFGLNESQEAAVLSCIGAGECCHQNTVKLVWGPPGTGKTKMVSSLLYALFRMKCRTLTCTPTNIAVLEVVSRVRNLIVEQLACKTYGIGDIVLFGNQERMKIADQSELLDVFLDYRIGVLEQCFADWNHILTSMVSLLEEPEEQYRLYLLENFTGKKEKEEKIGEKENQINFDQEKEKIHVQNERPPTMTLEEIVRKRFKSIVERLKFCIVNLYTHLPTSFMPLAVAKKMIRACNLLGSLETLLLSVNIPDEGLKHVIQGFKDFGCVSGDHKELSDTIKECLNVLKLLSTTFTVPNFNNQYELRKFCLANSCLLFCTASSSFRLHTEGMAPLHMLVIDEAAQLKECESTIPMQLSGLRHAILIGDERQLPAMVNSKISEEAGFGRSLFERLVKLGWKRNLLKIQYRMHPSISLFPNRQFYDMRILDGPNVKEETYTRHFLKGDLYGSYSFININQGKEEFGECQSFKNVVEVAVIADIVERLHKEFKSTKTKISIGVISPYKAQIFAVQDKIKKYISDTDCNFSVNVRSIDGFQGGEEDVIIFSTVRSNNRGSVGFLSNQQRANVALTRARHCLWILGNEATLIKSGSIWRTLVNDAKERGCFYNADEDRNLAQAIEVSLFEPVQPDTLLNMDSVMFRNAMWKVCFGDDFRRSVERIQNKKILTEVLSMLTKLSNGFHPSEQKRKLIGNNAASSELLEHCRVNGQLNIIWTIDIQLEGPFQVQVLKVLDILPASDISNLAHEFDTLFVNCNEDKLDRCRYKCIQGNSVVPMRWPVETASISEGSHPEDEVKLVTRPFGKLSLRDN